MRDDRRVDTGPSTAVNDIEARVSRNPRMTRGVRADGAGKDAAPPDLSSQRIVPFPVPVQRTRIDSIDLLRGTIMIVMALDHTRDFFGPGSLNPLDVGNPALFLTRWVTHFCAPLFILLAGVSAFLYGARRRSVGTVSRFLLTRGLFLIVIELTVVRFAWRFSFDLNLFILQVIWALGVSMMVLGLLVHLPRWAILSIGLAMIAGHDLFDGVRANDFGSAGWLWIILHQGGMLRIGPDIIVYVLYPLVPWIGVMALGYALGPLFRQECAARRRWLLALGILGIAGFIVLRASNLYGDPVPWTMQSSLMATALSFIDCAKYPPSLLYLAMTLGPGLVLLAAFESVHGRAADVVITYGRVPFLYYVAHLYLIHALAIALAWAMGGDPSWLLGYDPRHKPANYGLPLPGIYAMWLLVVCALYPLYHWFAGLKQRRTDWWLSYL